MDFPEINLGAIAPKVTPDQLELVKGIVNSRTGRLRATKPKIERNVPVEDRYGRVINYPSETSGKTAYLWRMVAFMVSPHHAHHCMPVMAFCDLPQRPSFEERRELEKEMDALADIVVSTIDPVKWVGVQRWAKALGGY